MSGLGDAVLASLILTAVNLAVSGLLAIDYYGPFYNAVICCGARRRARPGDTAEPGVFMLEIDGLSEQTLRRAIDEGHVPTIARWLDEGSHRLVPWECDLSCQTSASQAGILLGDNTDIPAFRWYDKVEARIVVSSSGADCAALEKRLSHGNGLLAEDGVSVGNLLSGDAAAVAVHVQHGVGAQQAAEGPAGPVRKSLRRDADRHADAARDGRRALVGAAPADARRAAPDQAHAQVRPDPRRRDRSPCGT